MEQDVFAARRGAGGARCITFVRVGADFRDQVDFRVYLEVFSIHR